MDQVIQWLIHGVPIGCIYGLRRDGLVLTYKTSGVFNLAFSGAGVLLRVVLLRRARDGCPIWLGFVVTVFIVGPLIGLLLDRCLFRFMRTASWQVKLVSALGLLIAFPEIVKAIFGHENGDAPPTLR